MFNPSLQSLSQLVLGSDARMRRYLSRYLLSAAVYAFSLLAQLAQVWMGHAPPVAGLAYVGVLAVTVSGCLLYTSPSPRDRQKSRMPSSA